MITKTTGYQSSDGTVHGSLTTAQHFEVVLLYKEYLNGEKSNRSSDEYMSHIANFVVGNQEKIIDILTTTSKSKPRARKINGGTKTRAKKSTRHEAEQFPLPMEDGPGSIPAA